MKSRPYKYNDKLFRYDFDNGMVEYISKADEEMRQDNREWQDKYGRDLWDIDGDGYMTLSSVGLHPDNWNNKAARDEYLFGWCCELDMESAALVRNFEKYELPYLMEKEEDT